MRRLVAFLRGGRGLSAFAAVALAWMVLVILEGAVVRATGSGAGCGNHWPLCNGDFVPHHPRVATIIEYTHRSMTGVCTGLVLALLAWTFLARIPGHRARRAAVWSGILLVTEALLGAVLVKGGFVGQNASDLRVLVQCVHFTNTLLLLAALTLTWWWQQPRSTLEATARGTRRIAALALAFTMLTGATGSVAALADTLFPSTSLEAGLLADLSSHSPLLIRMRWMHPAASLAAFALIVVLALRLAQPRRGILLSLLALQFVLGIADVLALAPVSLQVLHLLGADLLWIALVCFASLALERASAEARETLASSSAQLAIKSA